MNRKIRKQRQLSLKKHKIVKPNFNKLTDQGEKNFSFFSPLTCVEMDSSLDGFLLFYVIELTAGELAFSILRQV